ncbi:MAG: ribosome silencing factor [Defluviitaleaceae bacterium]|nr:ribosome silencing factor [Defluviitaleaceae bacterium]
MDNILRIAYKALDDKFGEDIKIIDLRGVSTLADYFVITHGNSDAQVKALADEAADKLTEAGLRVKSTEGYSGAKWVLLDFGDIIVHIFDKTNREFYNLERIWGDAPVVAMETTGERSGHKAAPSC